MLYKLVYSNMSFTNLVWHVGIVVLGRRLCTTVFHICMGSNPPDVVGFLRVLRFPPTSSSHISRIHCIYVRLIFI